MMHPMIDRLRHVLLIPLLVVAGGSLSSCELLKNALPQQLGAGQMPTVALSENALVSYPSVTMVAGYYCPSIVASVLPAFIPGQEVFLCEQVYGGQLPSQFQMQFIFELRYKFDNPNAFPVPALEMLTAIDVFAGRDVAQLGAVCAVLCPVGDPKCTGAPGPSSCKASTRDVASIDDFVQKSVPNLVGLLVNAAVTGDASNLAQRIIPPSAKAYLVKVQFSLGVAAMIDLLVKVASDAFSKWITGGALSAIDIPYAVHGTFWLDLQALGRVAIGFGPLKATWTIPVALPQ